MSQKFATQSLKKDEELAKRVDQLLMFRSTMTTEKNAKELHSKIFYVHTKYEKGRLKRVYI